MGSHRCIGIGLMFLLGSLVSYSAYGQTLAEMHQQLTEAYQAEDYETLLDLEKQALSAAKGQSDTTAAGVYYMLADAHFFIGYLDLAYDYYGESLAIYQQHESTSVGLVNDLLFNYMAAAMEMQAFEHAEELAEMLLANDRKEYGETSQEYIDDVVELGLIFRYQNKLSKAQNLYQQTLNKLPESHPQRYILIGAIGDLLVTEEAYSESEKYLLQALSLVEEHHGSNSFEYGSIVSNLAGLYFRWGKFPEAEVLYLQARALFDDQFQLTDLQLELKGTIENDLAMMYSTMGRYEEAEGLYKSILEREKELFGESDPNYAITEINLGVNYLEAKDFVASEKYLRDGIAILGATLGPDNYDYLLSKRQLAKLYQRQQRYEQALLVNEEVMKELASLLGKKHPTYARSLFIHGQLNAIQDNPKQALKLLERSRKIREGALGTSHPEYGQTTRMLAVVNWEADNLEAASEGYHSTFQNYFTQIEYVFPTLSEQEKAKFYNNTLRVTFEEFNSFAVSQAAEMPQLLGDMYNYRLATKALIMRTTSRVRERIAQQNDPALMEQFEEWVRVKERLSKFYSLSEAELAEQPITKEELESKANQLERELTAASSAFAETFMEKPVTWQDVRATLKPGEAAMEIIRFREFSPARGGHFSGQVHYAALLVSEQTPDHPRLILLENGTELESRYIAVYRNAIRYRIEEGYSYPMLWEPFQKELAGIEKLYFSPDGIYNQLNPSTLRDPESGKFVMDWLDVELVTNTRDLLEYATVAQGEGPTSGNATLIGFPNYNLGLASQELARLEAAKKVANTVTLDRGLRGSLQRYVQGNELLDLLPGTKTEVETIAQMYDEAQTSYNLLLEDEAIEEELKQVRNPKTLHIATHGFFLNDNPEASSGEADVYVTNPLLRSGLILAGANNFIAQGTDFSPLSGEDGVLTAFEAMNLNLEQTDLVVLSACETGLGEIKNGEGVYGLQRAFRVAGADAVVMSLWNVSDQATQELMTEFYRQWLAHGDKQQAFREAQLMLKEKYPEPYYWGAFVMVGR